MNNKNLAVFIALRNFVSSGKLRVAQQSINTIFIGGGFRFGLSD
jgi:hypothetical protein